MAKKIIKYEGFIQLEGGLHICFCGRFDDEKKIPSWLNALHGGQLPSDKVFTIWSEKQSSKFYIVTSKIVAFEFSRTETKIS